MDEQIKTEANEQTENGSGVQKHTQPRAALMIFGAVIALVLAGAFYFLVTSQFFTTTEDQRDIEDTTPEVLVSEEAVKQLFDGGDTDGALRAARSGFLKEPNNYQYELLEIAALLQIGSARFEERERAEEARTRINTLLLREDLATDARQELYRLLGYSYEIEGNYAVAISTYETGLAIDEAHAKLLNQIGHVHHLAGDIEAARTHYVRALEVDASLDQAHLNLGNIQYYIDQDLEAAQRSYETAEQLSEAVHVRAAAAYALSSIFFAEGDSEAAGAKLDEAISYDAGNPLLYVTRASRGIIESYDNPGVGGVYREPAGARNDLATAQALYENSAEGWYWLASLEAFLGNYASADEALMRAEASVDTDVLLLGDQRIRTAERISILRTFLNEQIAVYGREDLPRSDSAFSTVKQFVYDALLPEFAHAACERGEVCRVGGTLDRWVNQFAPHGVEVSGNVVICNNGYIVEVVDPPIVTPPPQQCTPERGGKGDTGADGRCGSAVDRGFSTEPNKGLCSRGSATAVSTRNPYEWTWRCSGLAGDPGKPGRCGGSRGPQGDRGESSELCVAKRTPVITELEACDLGGGGCNPVRKEIVVEEEVQIEWQVHNEAGGVSGCSSGNFALPTPTTWQGIDPNIREPYPGATKQFTLSCGGYWYNETNNPQYLTHETVDVYMHPLPTLSVDDYSVPIDTDINLYWDSNAPFACELYAGETLLADGLEGSGVEVYRLQSTTIFTLTCPNGSSSVTVFAIPVIFET